MKQKILNNWHTVRVVYLVIGVLISAYALVTKEWTGFLPGGYFILMAVFHFGCAAGGCYVVPNKKKKTKRDQQNPRLKK